MSSIQSPQPSFSGKTSPAIVFLIVIVAIVFIFCGLLHLLVKFILKNKPRSLGSQSIINYPEMSDSDTFQRQLQQLFELHDSGLDQAQIDALPVFHYKEINGLKEPFDCAVCLCEFSELDKLRLVPQCSHAFHVDCIDTWLLSNSTCPLCRRPLGPPNVVELEGPREEVESNTSEVEIVGQDRVVFPIRLGKFRSTDSEKGDVGFASSSNLGARRCYSMGSYQYVVDESVLQVALSSKRSANGGGGGGDVVVVKGRCSVDGEEEGKRISVASKNESFSVSKIWLWSKKGKFLGDTSSVDMALPWNTIV